MLYQLSYTPLPSMRAPRRPPLIDLLFTPSIQKKEKDRRDRGPVPFALLVIPIFPRRHPAPTVRPPSLIAKRSFSSIAIGWISVTSISALSPGITISVPSGKVT